ncbi:MAG: RNA polymerase subunit sigma-70 [Bacteroidales bacterium]
MIATISADIVSSTSLSKEDIIRLKERVDELWCILEKKYPGFWGRQIKGDYLECVIPNRADALRIALIIKSALKSFQTDNNDGARLFQSYGARIAIGFGDIRTVDRNDDIMDGEAIYLSGRRLEQMSQLSKGTLEVTCSAKKLEYILHPLFTLIDAIMNDATSKQCEVLYYKLFNKNETEIADILNIKQSAVNQRSTGGKWYAIETSLNFIENLNWQDYE